MAKQEHEPRPPMTLGNMRELGVRHLIAEAPAAYRGFFIFSLCC
jgi:hypothetical protein